jgi:hypothetical protein
MEPEKDILNQQIKRIVVSLFKDFLAILQDVQQDNLFNISTLSKQFPPEFVDKINILDLPKYSRLRKRILDKSNDSLREIETLINSFDVRLYNSKDKE